jgi:hypothetical protein
MVEPMGEKLTESLKQFLQSGKDWERRPTSVPGVFIMKLPAYRRSPSRLVAEVNPADSYGNPTKKRGLLVRSFPDLQNYRELLAKENLDDLLKGLDEVNPPAAERGKTKSEIIQI